MPFKRFHKTSVADRDLQLVQDAAKASFDSLTTVPILAMSLIAQVPLAVGTNTIAHGLGRAYVSAIPGLPSAPATLSIGASPDRTKFLSVTASAACSVDLVVF